MAMHCEFVLRLPTEPADDSEEERLRAFRNKVANEIYETEKHYVASLELLMEAFISPLEQDDSLLPPHCIRQTSGTLEILLNIAKMLLARIESRLSNWVAEREMLGDVFLSEVVGALKMYTTYVSTYTATNVTLQAEREKSKKLQEFLVTTRDAKAGGLDINSYLILPVQRVPRYALLLSEFLKYTPESHPDYNNIVNAQAEVKKVGDYVNEKQRTAECMREVLRIEKKILTPEGERVSIVRPHRKLVNKGKFKVVSEISLKPGTEKNISTIDLVCESRPCQLYLLNTHLLVCTQIEKAEKEKGKEKEKETDDAPTAVRRVMATSGSRSRISGSRLKSSGKINAIEKKASDLEPQYILETRIKLKGAVVRDMMDMVGMQHAFSVVVQPRTDDELKATFLCASAIEKQQWMVIVQNAVDERRDLSDQRNSAIFESEGSEGGPNVPVDVQLTDRDWRVLVTNSTDIKYNKGDVVFKEGGMNTMLHRLTEGSLKIMKGGVPVTTLLPPALLGELTFLGRPEVSATVVAGEDNTVMQVMEASFIRQLFQYQPDLAYKFYRNMALNLSARLRDVHTRRPATPTGKASGAPPPRPSGPAPKPSERLRSKSGTFQTIQRPASNDGLDARVAKLALDTAKSPSSPEDSATITSARDERSQSKDTKFQKEFSLGPDEILLGEVAVRYSGRAGAMFIGQSCACFLAKGFGYHEKRVMPYANVVRVSSTRDKKGESGGTLVIAVNKGKALKKDINVNPLKASKHQKELKFLLKDKAQLKDIMALVYGLVDSVKSKQSMIGGTSEPLDLRNRQNLKERSIEKDPEMPSGADWRLLLKCAKHITYKKGAAILVQGSHAQRVFQIMNGECAVSIADESRPGVMTDVAVLKSEELFGEISLLQGGPASAFVIAATETVDVLVMEGFTLQLLFGLKPGLSARFYKYLATVLAWRLRQREAAQL
eukprot:TRINITY_DN5862_c0_g2_i1.p1 TRINITY_DN5862_c0_g2~~TRINITY_DN5862_c0_g2_i1.p1  ORF type:complete len:947 (+),score=249.04 TRINITY_DN5862_c0_g2_i1:250-3090(+)